MELPRFIEGLNVGDNLRNAGAPRNLGDAGHWTPIPLVTCILADQLLLVRGISADDLNSKSIMQSHPHSIELRDPSCYDRPGRDGGGLADEVSAARVDREPGGLQAGPGSALGIRQHSPVRIYRDWTRKQVLWVVSDIGQCPGCGAAALNWQFLTHVNAEPQRSASEVKLSSGSQALHIGAISKAAVALLSCRFYEDADLGQHLDCTGSGRLAGAEQ